MGYATYLYHPIHGAQRFDSDALPDLDLGWFDHPKKFPAEIPDEWRKVSKIDAMRPRAKTVAEVEAEASRSTDPSFPDPLRFPNFDDYMEDFVSRLDPSLSNHEKGMRKRGAIEHYGMVKHQAKLQGKTLSELADEIEALEGGQ